MTTQAQVRAAFWVQHGKNFPRGKNMYGEYNGDARMAFVDFVDHLARSGEISEALAQRVTL